MAEDGLWLSRKQRRTFHQPRRRRDAFGELIQIDGSEHRWFEDRRDPCTLLVFVDDATIKLLELWFVASESAFAYFTALESYLGRYGPPVAFYSDKHSVFRVSRPSQHGNGMTQFGRALAELNIEILCANSSQAKGRVERVKGPCRTGWSRSCGPPASATWPRPTRICRASSRAKTPGFPGRRSIRTTCTAP